MWVIPHENLKTSQVESVQRRCFRLTGFRIGIVAFLLRLFSLSPSPTAPLCWLYPLYWAGWKPLRFVALRKSLVLCFDVVPVLFDYRAHTACRVESWVTVMFPSTHPCRGATPIEGWCSWYQRQMRALFLSSISCSKSCPTYIIHIWTMTSLNSSLVFPGVLFWLSLAAFYRMSSHRWHMWLSWPFSCCQWLLSSKHPFVPTGKRG